MVVELKDGDETKALTTKELNMINELLDNVPSLVPGVPNSSWVPVLVGQARVALAAAAALGFGWGKWVSGDQLNIYVSVTVFIAALAWSAWQHVKAQRAKYRAAATAAVRSASQSANVSVQLQEPAAVAVVPNIPAVVSSSPRAASIVSSGG